MNKPTFPAPLVAYFDQREAEGRRLVDELVEIYRETSAEFGHTTASIYLVERLSHLSHPSDPQLSGTLAELLTIATSRLAAQ